MSSFGRTKKESAECSKHPGKPGLKAQCCICRAVPLCAECLRVELQSDGGGYAFYCSGCRPNARRPPSSLVEFLQPPPGWQPPG